MYRRSMDLYRIENDLRDRDSRMSWEPTKRGGVAHGRTALVAAAWILPPGLVIPGLNDSRN